MDKMLLDVLNGKYCAQCPLLRSQDHLLVRNQTIELNSKYVPKKEIELLLVAESPPWAFLQDKHSYFYAPGPIKYGTLSYHISSVLFKEAIREKEDFLQRFRAGGLYLLDVVKCPINKLTKDKKREAVRACSKYLNDELHTLKPKKVVFIGKGSFKIARDQIKLDFDPSVIPLPFGSQRNVEKFRKGLHEAMVNQSESPAVRRRCD